jgi:spermidine synthase
MFCSGALALMYEILWMRRFTALFGASTPAVAATLAAMFLGMGLGSALIGKQAAKMMRLLRGYGILELGIAIGALLVEPALMVYERVGPGSLGAKTGCALIALFLPSFCMGGTIPVLGHAVAAESRRLGIKIGGLYAANLLGATVGAFSVPFLWLPNLTARMTYGVCIGLSTLIGIIAILLDRPMAATAPELTERPRHVERSLSWSAVILFAALSGLVLFMLQVLWSRMFAQVHENSIYSFSLVLGFLLIALGVGSAATKFLLQRGFPARGLLACAWVISGVVICFTPLVFYRLTNGLLFLEGSWGGGSYPFKLLALAVPTVLLPTMFAGMVLPLLSEIAGAISRDPAGRLVGALFAVNTAGSVIGSLVAAFVLPKLFGLWSALFLIGAVMTVAGGFCSRPALGGVALAIVAACFFFIRPAELPRVKYRPQQGERLLAVKESSHGIVAVVERGNSRRMKLNNSYILGGTASTGDERLQAHVPLLLHPNPRKVAFLGFGTGITAGAALLHPVESITAVEIVPDVIRAAGAYFSAANLDVLNSPRARLVADDARSFLRSGSDDFDVIIADLFVPWHQGEALLYTADQFQSARRRLKPGGVFCQWLPMFQLSEEQFYMVAATFLDVFETATLWRGDFSPQQPALALIAYPSVDAATVERRVRELQPDPANAMLRHPAGLWIFFVGALDASTPQFRTARRNRENQPWLEILGPLNRSGSFIGGNLEEFLAQVSTNTGLFTGLTAEHHHWRQAGAAIAKGTSLIASGHAEEGEKLIQHSIRILPAEVQEAVGSPQPEM